MRAGANQGQVTAAPADAPGRGFAGRANGTRGDLDRLIDMLDDAVLRRNQQSGRQISARPVSGQAGETPATGVR